MTLKETIEARIGKAEAAIEHMDRRLIFGDIQTKDELSAFLAEMRTLLDVAIAAKDGMASDTEDFESFRRKAEKYDRVSRAFRTMMEEC